MSRKVPIANLSDEEIREINKNLCIQQEVSKYAFSSTPKVFSVFESEGEYVYLPFAYASEYRRPGRENFGIISGSFSGELRTEQKVVKSEAINFLNSTGSVILSAYPGFGKTAMSIYIACKIGLKTLIICHRIVLINQWEKAINNFCPEATVQILDPKEKIDKDADFYIVNAGNVPKWSRKEFVKIGLVIVDEVHIIMAEKLSQSMRYFTPRYLIGLSATPYRTDGLGVLFDLYFGEHKIVRELKREHIVYAVHTGIKPEVKLTKMGKVDWGSVLKSQCENKERNELIISIINYFPDKVFLVLCKRIDQAKYLMKRLKEEKEDVTGLFGTSQSYEQSSRILVGTVGKCAVGFDHPRLNAMILASDVEQYFTQYIGRIMRTEYGIPVIFDLIDDYSLLKKHYRTRSATYLECKGKIKNFWESFPNFPSS